MLNTFYITDRATMEVHKDFFHPQLGFHGIDLPDGRILLSAHFPTNHWNIENWERQPGVEKLPHPIFEGTQPIEDRHVEALSHLGIAKGHTVIDVARVAAAIHPLMKLRQF
jgi:hypothetical protein